MKREPDTFSATRRGISVIPQLIASFSRMLRMTRSAALGTDKYGTTWAAKLNPDGTQTWVGIRGGKVSYGGVNQTPKSFNPQTGLASPTKPGK